ncbi:hypothetical protein Pmani_022031 [Petrolisthes manimaculis]|uniref:Trafficking protein particle complex subunit 10 n=1 Tax=Petrolisthes manimaculis TaxID=1843537 RepID=A0AAE1U4P5_9EUCA|nr:hypothetical protein Pmani_022031 [Petrolisthes manimaculis]
MNRRPIVTYAGDNSLFSGLQAGLVTSLPQESVEWRRSYGRPSRCVHVEVDFVPFSEECLVKDAPRTILGQPIFHTYWTDCLDVEAYKSTTRESLHSWMMSLKHHGVTDWMVVLLEAPDSRKGNKLLPRTTVLDKIKNDFGGKQAERCVSMVDPLKSDSRSMESWQTLLTKMRHLLMVAYNRALNKFEEAMRAERERRTEKSWSFCSYFLLQEELAQVFTLLALHDEALVQYDELDALFTQFVLNSAAGDTAPWLSMFGQPCERWEGLHLTPSLDMGIQSKIRAREVTLLEFRNYLFQRQCALLTHLNKPWEIACRALNFLQNTVGELRILEVGVGAGGVACWGLLSCLEVVDALQDYKDPTTTDAHALHTAPLYAYARDKLQELGHLCGLMPGEGRGSSAQLHTVIALVCGMGNDPHAHDDPHQDPSSRDTPMTRLKDAVSSPQAFKKHFLDLSEVAISTYKHIGRIRSARLIGRDLANYYMAEGEPQKAATFLTDQLTVFLEEGWPTLAARTHLRLAQCYQATNDTERYIRTCAQLAASEVLEGEVRKEHFNNMMKAVQQVKPDSPMLIPSERVLEVGGPKVVSTGRLIPGTEVTVELTITSKLPADVRCREISLMLQHWEEEEEVVGVKKASEVERKGSSSSATPPGGKHAHHHHHNHPATVHRSGSSSESERSNSSSSSVGGGGGSSGSGGGGSGSCDGGVEGGEGEVVRGDTVTQPLLMSLHLEYKQDKSLSSASVTCTNAHKVLRRRDSQGGLYKVERSISRQHLPDRLTASNLTLAPGHNTITLTTKVEKRGRYVGGQVVVGLEGAVEVVAGRGSLVGHPLSLEVVSEGPRVFLGRRDRDLLAGITQPMILTVHSGSAHVAEGTVVKLSTSRGLTLQCDESVNRDLTREVEVRLSQVDPFSSLAVPLTVLADLGPQRDAATVEHTVSLSSSITEGRQDIDVHFIPPFMTSHKLHTAASAKFLQVTVTGLVGRAVELTEPQLWAVDGHLPLKPLHPPSQSLVVCSDQSASYMWGMEVDYQKDETPPVKVEFSILYRPLDTVSHETKDTTTKNPLQDLDTDEPPSDPPPDPPRAYTSSFEILDYKTLYTIRARVEPSKGSELCRAGNMCHLHIALQQVWAGGTPVLDSEGDSGTTTNPQHQLHSIMYEVLADQTMWAVCGRTAGVLTLEDGVRQSVTMDVMPLTGGFLPLPSVRLSKYIPADSKQATPKDGGKKVEYVGSASSVPRLQPFSPGQVYNFSKAQQVHVLPASNTLQQEISLS